MQKISAVICFVFWWFALVGYGQLSEPESKQIQVAFLADVHFQDIYGTFQDHAFQGVQIPNTKKIVLARTMKAQLNSTRIFNENYFALLAALDEIVEKKIKYVVLPGDFSDDGQPVNVRGLKTILDTYATNYGIRFLVTTGNHDPVRPWSMEAGKVDFLGQEGKQQAIMSAEGMYMPKSASENPVHITKDIRKLGYQEIISSLGDFGFFPVKSDIYWETPFTDYSYNDYSFKKSLQYSSIDQRTYPIPPHGAPVPDVSYLVEPEQGIWFLAIDANVYLPDTKDNFNSGNPNHYQSANEGYNNVLTHKNHLISWVKKVTDEAKKRGKTLIVFSHYPMIDFYDDASSNIKNLLGEGKMQLHRMPQESVASIFADAGVVLHFGGHMHINDTGVRKSKNGNTIVNVQIPSLAAYIPAFKILTVQKHNVMEIQTVTIDSVPGFRELFPLYEQEYAYLSSIGDPEIWDKEILSANTYHEFTNLHLKQLVRSRFIEDDWPVDFKRFLENASGADLLAYANSSIMDSSFDRNPYLQWTGFDMLFDLYRLRSADKLALKDIGMTRIKQYELIIASLINADRVQSLNNGTLYTDFREFANILHKFMNGAPADHFTVDLSNGEITNLGK